MIGGGNIFRGIRGTEAGMDRASADQMGLLATVINGIALQDALEKEGVVTRHVSAIEIKSVAEPFIRRRVAPPPRKGPHRRSSPPASAAPISRRTRRPPSAPWRSRPTIILKATKVDGVYTADPVTDRTAKKFETISYLDVLQKGLRVMDTTAISLCKDNDLPIVVFNLNERGNIRNAVLGENVGTKVS